MNNQNIGYAGEIYIHSEVMEKLKQIIPTVDYRPTFNDLNLHVDIAVPKHPKKWEFPQCRFVEYEPKDEEWARPLRHGREVDDTSRYVGFTVKHRDYLIQQINLKMYEELSSWDGTLYGKPIEHIEQTYTSGERSFIARNIISGYSWVAYNCSY